MRRIASLIIAFWLAFSGLASGFCYLVLFGVLEVEGVGATSRWICVCGRSGVALLGSHSHRAGRRQLREAGSSHLTSVLHLRLRLVPHSPSSSASHGYRPADRGAMRLALLTR